MGQITPFQFDSPKLLAFYLGGRVEGFNLELHDVQFHVGTNHIEVLKKVKGQWKGTLRSLHVDSWVSLDSVDGYTIELLKKRPVKKEKLYLINLGYYLNKEFGEFHKLQFVVSTSVAGAKKLAKKFLLKRSYEPHTDDSFDIDDCIEVSKVDGFHIHLKKSKNAKLNPISNGWQKLPKEFY